MEFRYRHHDADHAIRLEHQPDGSLRAYVAGQEHSIQVLSSPEGQLNLLIDGQRVHAYAAATRTPQMHLDLRYVALVDRETCFFELEKVTGSGRQRSGKQAASGALTAQMPGQVMEVAVEEGITVNEGDLILLLEAMKMEIRVTAPLSGTLERLNVSVGDQVERGQMLAEIKPGGID